MSHATPTPERLRRLGKIRDLLKSLLPENLTSESDDVVESHMVSLDRAKKNIESLTKVLTAYNDLQDDDDKDTIPSESFIDHISLEALWNIVDSTLYIFEFLSPQSMHSEGVTKHADAHSKTLGKPKPAAKPVPKMVKDGSKHHADNAHSHHHPLMNTGAKTSVGKIDQETPHGARPEYQDDDNVYSYHRRQSQLNTNAKTPTKQTSQETPHGARPEYQDDDNVYSYHRRQSQLNTGAKTPAKKTDQEPPHGARPEYQDDDNVYSYHRRQSQLNTGAKTPAKKTGQEASRDVRSEMFNQRRIAQYKRNIDHPEPDHDGSDEEELVNANAMFEEVASKGYHPLDDDNDGDDDDDVVSDDHYYAATAPNTPHEVKSRHALVHSASSSSSKKESHLLTAGKVSAKSVSAAVSRSIQPARFNQPAATHAGIWEEPEDHEELVRANEMLSGYGQVADNDEEEDGVVVQNDDFVAPPPKKTAMHKPRIVSPAQASFNAEYNFTQRLKGLKTMPASAPDTGTPIDLFGWLLTSVLRDVFVKEDGGVVSNECLTVLEGIVKQNTRSAAQAQQTSNRNAVAVINITKTDHHQMLFRTHFCFFWESIHMFNDRLADENVGLEPFEVYAYADNYWNRAIDTFLRGVDMEDSINSNELDKYRTSLRNSYLRILFEKNKINARYLVHGGAPHLPNTRAARQAMATGAKMPQQSSSHTNRIGGLEEIDATINSRSTLPKDKMDNKFIRAVAALMYPTQFDKSKTQVAEFNKCVAGVYTLLDGLAELGWKPVSYADESVVPKNKEALTKAQKDTPQSIKIAEAMAAVYSLNKRIMGDGITNTHVEEVGTDDRDKRITKLFISILVACRI